MRSFSGVIQRAAGSSRIQAVRTRDNVPNISVSILTFFRYTSSINVYFWKKPPSSSSSRCLCLFVCLFVCLCLFVIVEAPPGTVSPAAVASLRRPGPPARLSSPPAASGCCCLGGGDTREQVYHDTFDFAAECAMVITGSVQSRLNIEKCTS